MSESGSTPASDSRGPGTPAARIASLRRPLALGALYLVLFSPQIARLADTAWGEEKYSHAWLIPLVSLFYLFANREQIAAAPRRPANVGLLFVGLGVAGWVYAQLRDVNALAHLSMMSALIGMIVFTAGWTFFRAVAFPVLYLGFMFPVPLHWDERYVVLPLQSVASRMGEGILDLVGVPVFRQGNVIDVPGAKLFVEEACSGIRSLYSLTALGTAFVFLFDRRPWERVLIIAATVPIAVLANVIRVAGTGMLVYWISPKMAKGWIHDSAGMLVFLIGLLLLLAFAALLRLLFPMPEEPSEG